MTEPQDDYRVILEELGGVYASVDWGQVKPTHRRAVQVAHGWFMNVERGCEAVLALRVTGYAPEAWPIRRSVIEHVISLNWLAVEGEKVVDPIVRALAEQGSRRLAAARAAGWKAAGLPIWELVQQDGHAAQEDFAQDTYLHFKHRVETFGSPDAFAGWLITTAHSHPGWESASPYLEPPGTLLWEPKECDVDDVAQCTMSMWGALSAVDRMMSSPQWSELRTLQDRIVALTQTSNEQ